MDEEPEHHGPHREQSGSPGGADSSGNPGLRGHKAVSPCGAAAAGRGCWIFVPLNPPETERPRITGLDQREPCGSRERGREKLRGGGEQDPGPEGGEGLKSPQRE